MITNIKPVKLVKHTKGLDTYYVYEVSLWLFIVSENEDNTWDIHVRNIDDKEWNYSKSSLIKAENSIKRWLKKNREDNFKICMRFT